MNEDRRNFIISSIKDIIDKNMLFFSVQIAEQIVSFIEEEEEGKNKMEESNQYFNPHYVNDED